MKHQNYFEEYTIEDVESRTVSWSRASQTEMIQRAYPEYIPDEDWVLWLVIDIFDKLAEDNLEAIVNIRKQSGEEIAFTPILRKPYPNVYIHQVALYPSDNRKRVYGIPLVFKTFKEIEEIKEISIKWIKTYIKNDLAEKNKSCVFAEILHVKYNTVFEENDAYPQHRMFTVFSRDQFYRSFYDENSGLTEDVKKEYYDQFVDARHLNVVASVKTDRIVNSFGYIIENKENKENDLLLKDMQQKYGHNFKNTPEGILLMNNVKTLLWKSDLKELFGYMITYQECSKTLKATYLAGVLPEPCFGFK